MKTAKKLFFIFFMIMIMVSICPFTAQAANLKLNHKELVMNINDTKILKVTGNGKKKIQWKSSDSAVVKIGKEGKLKAKKAGTVTITAKVKSKKLTCKVTVKESGIKSGVNSRMKKQAKQNAKIYTKQIEEMIKDTNYYRKKKGLSKLKENKKLTEIACYRSIEMAQEDKMTHVRPDGTKVKDLMKQYGFKFHVVKENVGYEYDSEGVDVNPDFVEEWYESTSHRRNMFTKNMKEIGIGIAYADESTIYYTQLFVY